MDNLRIPNNARHMLLAALIVAGILYVVTPQPADAIGPVLILGVAAALGGGFALYKFGSDLIGDIANKALEALVGLLGVFADASSSLMQLTGQFFTLALVDVNGTVSFYENPFVQAGWGLVRDFANFGFVIFLLIAAIATILGLEQYSAKRIVPRLIIVALLVNFSLPIAALFINITQVLMEFFVIHLAQQAGYKDIGNAIVNGLRAGEFTNINPSVDLGSAAVSSLFQIIFSLVAAFTFLVLGVAFIIRIVALWVLLILSPLAVVAAVLPQTQRYWNQWLGQLVHWATFGIGAAFFMYLATALTFYLNTGALGKTSQEFSGHASLSSFFTAGEHMLAYVTTLVFLFISMSLARQGAGAIATTAVNTAGTAAVAGLGFGYAVAGRPALQRAGRAAVESRRLRDIAGGVTEEGEGRGVAGALLTNRVLRRIPGAAGLGRQLSTFGAAAPLLQEAEKKKKEFGRYASPVLAANASRAEAPQNEKIAAAQIIIQRADMDLPDKLAGDVMNIGIGTGDKRLINQVLSARPDLASVAAQSGIEGYADMTKAKAARLYGGRALTKKNAGDIEIVGNLEDRALNEIALYGRRSIRQSVTETVQAIKAATPEQAAQAGITWEQVKYLAEKIERKPAFIQTIGGAPRALPVSQEEIQAAEEATVHETETPS